MTGIAAKCFRALSHLFSSNQIDQSSCKMILLFAGVVRFLYDDWSIRLRENRPFRVLKHLAAILQSLYRRQLLTQNATRKCTCECLVTYFSHIVASKPCSTDVEKLINNCEMFDSVALAEDSLISYLYICGVSSSV